MYVHCTIHCNTVEATGKHTIYAISTIIYEHIVVRKDIYFVFAQGHAKVDETPNY
jgi:hypothetical protein